MRRDRLGRRIGRNWWREMICGSLAGAEQAWWLEREAVALGYQTEMQEFQEQNPRPTLRLFLETHAGMAGQPG